METVDADDVKPDLELVNERKSSRRPTLTYHSIRGSPTAFHIRGTHLLLPSLASRTGWAVTFAANAGSYAVEALRMIHQKFLRQRYILGQGVTAILERHAKVFDASGQQIDSSLAELGGWELNVILILRGIWQTEFHSGLRIEVAEIQLVQKHTPAVHA